MVVPTFSLFVVHLGGSVVLIGLLAATVSVTQVLGAFPVGSLSDRFGRKTAFVGGAALFSLASLLVAFQSDPLLLIIPRIIYGVALLATFPVGLAYLADVIAPSRRALAIGIYVSAQGLGFAVGPLLGGWIASAYGFRTVYTVCAVIGLVAAIGSWIAMENPKATVRQKERLLAIRAFLHGPIFGASISNTFMLLMANGAVLPFLSLYGVQLGLTTLEVGVLYALRSGASVLARVPAGLVSRRVANSTLVLFALALDAGAAFAIGLSSDPTPLFIAAVADGIAFGIFMTAGQVIVADHAPRERRGAAIGSYAAAGALGETIGALSFGVLAQAVSLRSVFFVAGAMLVLCIPTVWGMLRPHSTWTANTAA
jgi:MFS transporter, DHA1 family, multidrug resistance protein